MLLIYTACYIEFIMSNIFDKYKTERISISETAQYLYEKKIMEAVRDGYTVNLTCVDLEPNENGGSTFTYKACLHKFVKA